MQAKIINIGRNLIILMIGLLVVKSCGLLTALMAEKKQLAVTVGASKIKHLAIVMDGNRRWAKRLGLSSLQGHLEGVGAIERTIKFCLAEGIGILSLYAFSIENLKRSEEEKDYLFGMVSEVLKEWPPMLDENNIKIRFVGDRKLFPSKISDVVERLEAKTVKNSGLLLNIMFCYGGQQEIVAAAQELAKKVRAGKIRPEDINVEMFSQHTWTGDLPQPDVIFRPGERERISNFMSFAGAYSEIRFSNKAWPETRMVDLEKIKADFALAQRTFGC